MNNIVVGLIVLSNLVFGASYYGYEMGKPLKRDYFGLFDSFYVNKDKDVTVYEKELKDDYFKNVTLRTNNKGNIFSILLHKVAENENEFIEVLGKLESKYGKFNCTRDYMSNSNLKFLFGELINSPYNTEKEGFIGFSCKTTNSDGVEITVFHSSPYSKALNVQYIDKSVKVGLEKL